MKYTHSLRIFTVFIFLLHSLSTYLGFPFYIKYIFLHSPFKYTSIFISYKKQKQRISQLKRYYFENKPLLFIWKLCHALMPPLLELKESEHSIPIYLSHAIYSRYSKLSYPARGFTSQIEDQSGWFQYRGSFVLLFILSLPLIHFHFYYIYIPHKMGARSVQQQVKGRHICRQWHTNIFYSPVCFFIPFLSILKFSFVYCFFFFSFFCFSFDWLIWGWFGFFLATECWHVHWTIHHNLKSWLLCNNGHFKAHKFKFGAAAVYITPNWILSARLLFHLTRSFYSSSHVVLISTTLNKSMSSLNLLTLLCTPFSSSFLDVN